MGLGGTSEVFNESGALNERCAAVARPTAVDREAEVARLAVALVAVIIAGRKS